MPRRSVVVLGWLCATACVQPPAADAESGAQTDAMDRVHYRVECTREVANDRITAVLGISDEDSEAPRLANRVNETMQWALERSRRVSSVDVQSGHYRIQPVHKDGKIRRWRASQDVVLSSGDVAAVTGLIGELQNRLLVRSVQFGVSRERRDEVNEALIAECLAAYQSRGEAIREALGARGFGLVELRIDPPGGGAPRHRAYAMQESFSAVAEPGFEAGESELSIGVQATIELER